jgi:Na(+)-translocating NADH:ubiquinone oxidoreductase A subunit
MKCQGGYTIPLAGKPSDEIRHLPQADVLYLPRSSPRFNFSEICIDDGQEVKAGDVLAQDSDNYLVPLLAPSPGAAKTVSSTTHILLEQVRKEAPEAVSIGADIPEKAAAMGDAGKMRYALLRLGAWQFFSDAFSGKLPDPYGTPQAIIVSTLCMEPFTASAAAISRDRFTNFAQGLEHIHSLADNKPVYVIVSNCRTDVSARLSEAMRKCTWASQITVAPRYPFGNARVIAQLLGLRGSSDAGSVWAVGLEGVMAVDCALSTSKPYVSRIISVGGPGAKNPSHISAVPGYPMKNILGQYLAVSPSRVISGGVLTGETIGEKQLGLDVECGGITLVAEKVKRDVLGFARVGIAQNSYSNTFLSAMIPGFRERSTTGIRGEGRPCVSCGFCEDACPVRIMPHLVYRYANKNRLEEAEKYGLSKCTGCGICSYVCPSKIDVKKVLLDAQEALKNELLTEEAQS